MEAVLVGEQGVPDPDDVRQEELLRQQQGEPAEGEVLRLDVLLLLNGQKKQPVTMTFMENRVHLTESGCLGFNGSV